MRYDLFFSLLSHMMIQKLTEAKPVRADITSQRLSNAALSVRIDAGCLGGWVIGLVPVYST